MNLECLKLFIRLNKNQKKMHFWKISFEISPLGTLKIVKETTQYTTVNRQNIIKLAAKLFHIFIDRLHFEQHVLLSFF